MGASPSTLQARDTARSGVLNNDERSPECGWPTESRQRLRRFQCLADAQQTHLRPARPDNLHADRQTVVVLPAGATSAGSPARLPIASSAPWPKYGAGRPSTVSGAPGSQWGNAVVIAGGISSASKSAKKRSQIAASRSRRSSAAKYHARSLVAAFRSDRRHQFAEQRVRASQSHAGNRSSTRAPALAARPATRSTRSLQRARRPRLRGRWARRRSADRRGVRRGSSTSGTGGTSVSIPSGPATIDSASARSSRLRASGPRHDRMRTVRGAPGGRRKNPVIGTRCSVGLRP